MPDYELRIHPPPVLGVDKRTEEVLLNPLYSPRLKNMVCLPSKLRKFRGYSKLGSNLPRLGTGMELLEFIDGAGSSHQIACTSRFIYKYGGDTDEWSIISDGIQLHTCEANWNSALETIAYDTTYFKQGSKSVKITLAAERADGVVLAYSSDFSALDITDANSDRSVDLNSISFWIRSSIALSSGDLELVISESSGGAKSGTYITIELDLAITADTWTLIEVSTTQTTLNAVISIGLHANATIASGAIIYIDDIWARFAFTETSTRWSHTVLNDSGHPLSWAHATALGLSNAVDLPICWDGAAATFRELITTSIISGFDHVVELGFHYNHLFLYNYFISSVYYKRSARYSDVGDLDDFSAGTSGEEVLTDSIGVIQRIKQFKKVVTIYSDKSIGLQYHVGGRAIFSFDTIIKEAGLFSPKALWDAALIHYLLGSDQRFYGFTGGSELLPIGSRFEENFFSRLDLPNKDKIVFGYDEGRHKLYIFYPDKEQQDTTAKAFFALNLSQNPVSIEEGRFYHSVRDFSIYSNKVVYTCNGIFFNPSGAAAHTCDEYPSLRCNDAYLQDTYPMATFISDDGNVFKINEGSGKFDDQNIECIIETPDYVITPGTEEYEGRWTQLSFNGCSEKSVSVSDSTVSVYHSTDYGETWTEFNDSPITLTTAWTEHQLEFDIKNRRVRFKFTQLSDGDFQIRGLSTKVKPETIRS